MKCSEDFSRIDITKIGMSSAWILFKRNQLVLPEQKHLYQNNLIFYKSLLNILQKILIEAKAAFRPYMNLPLKSNLQLHENISKECIKINFKQTNIGKFIPT